MNVLIVGGAGGIGLGLVEHLLESKPDAVVYATYLSQKPDFQHSRLHWFCVDASVELDVKQLAAKIPQLSILINAAGRLKIKAQKPEKSITEFDLLFFEKNISANTLPTLLLSKYFHSHLKSAFPSYFVSLSARIGSIEDNRLGGWISYRCSKAALNMAIKTLSIEWKYKLPNCCVLSFHPGTTKTNLSKDFQKNVPEEKLFTPSFVAQALFSVIKSKTALDSGKFFDYAGEEIPW